MKVIAKSVVGSVTGVSILIVMEVENEAASDRAGRITRTMFQSLLLWKSKMKVFGCLRSFQRQRSFNPYCYGSRK